MGVIMQETSKHLAQLGLVAELARSVHAEADMLNGIAREVDELTNDARGE